MAPALPPAPAPLDLRQLLENEIFGRLGPLTDTSTDDVREALVGAASEVLRKTPRAAVIDTVAGPLLLATIAAVVTRRADARGTRWAEGPSLMRDLRAAVPHLVVAATICDARGLSVAQLMDDGAEAKKVIEEAARFIDGIAPRNPRSLVLRGDDLSARICHFVKALSWKEVELMTWAAQALKDAGHADEPWNRSLLSRLGVSRLRTLPADVLARVAANDRRWRPLVEALAGQRPLTDDLSARLEDLRRQLTAQLCRYWRSQDASVAEEAARAAIAEAITLCRDPHRGYSYEGGFLAWLASMALNGLRSASRRALEDQLDAQREPEAPAQAPTDVEAAELLAEWRARYLLVETFFQARAVPRVKAIWEWMLLYTRSDGRADGPDVRAYVEARTGQADNENTLAGTVRRLRMRLESVRYVRDLVPDRGAEDSDPALLAHIARLYGLHDVDVATIRGIAALVRACRRPRELHAARLAQLVVHGGQRPDLAAAFWEVHRCGHESEQARGRFNRALRLWLPNDRATSGKEQARARRVPAWRPRSSERADAVRTLRTKAMSTKAAFLLAPCWCLAVFDGMTADLAVRRLLPWSEAASHEVEWIKLMVVGLSKELEP